MPNLPNIQREVLEYVLENADGPHDAVNLRDSSLSEEYGQNRVLKKAGETGVLTCGVSMLHPWYQDEQEVRDRIAAFEGADGD